MSQNTHVKHVQMDSISDGSLLLDLGGLAVDRIEADAFGGRVVHVVTEGVTVGSVYWGLVTTNTWQEVRHHSHLVLSQKTHIRKRQLQKIIGRRPS